MLLRLAMLLTLSAAVDDALEPAGAIHGIVVNGTEANEPLSGMPVILRAGVDGALEPVAETQTDMYGKFVFEGLPLDRAIVFLPGADRESVHYPGGRVRLDIGSRVGQVTIVTFDAINSPSPLVARLHEVDIEVGQDVMQVNETLSITNASRTTYVGEATEGTRAVTLRLSVPTNFDRVTFGSEFYGRRFRIVEHRPVTDIPFPPGERELKFSYRIPLESSGGVYRRGLDMPCSKFRLRVRGVDAKQVSCNLPLASENQDGEALFVSDDEYLPAGHVIELRAGIVPFPWMQLARWGSLVALAAISVVTGVVIRRRDPFTCLTERSGRTDESRRHAKRSSSAVRSP